MTPRPAPLARRSFFWRCALPSPCLRPGGGGKSAASPPLVQIPVGAHRQGCRAPPSPCGRVGPRSGPGRAAGGVSRRRATVRQSPAPYGRARARRSPPAGCAGHLPHAGGGVHQHECSVPAPPAASALAAFDAPVCGFWDCARGFGALRPPPSSAPSGHLLPAGWEKGSLTAAATCLFSRRQAGEGARRADEGRSAGAEATPATPPCAPEDVAGSSVDEQNRSVGGRWSGPAVSTIRARTRPGSAWLPWSSQKRQWSPSASCRSSALLSRPRSNASPVRSA